jgi:hypothetical protein
MKETAIDWRGAGCLNQRACGRARFPGNWTESMPGTNHRTTIGIGLVELSGLALSSPQETGESIDSRLFPYTTIR